jgi:Domain of unknown function (DUF222)
LLNVVNPDMIEPMFEGDDIIAAAQHWERVIAHAQAQQLKAIAELAELRRRPGGQLDDYTADEIAVALSISGTAAGQRLHLALDLADRLPATLAALERGGIDVLRARVICEATRPLSAEQAAQVEQRVLERALEQTAPQLRQSVKRAVLQIDPEGGQARYQQHRTDRRIVITPAEDGMAELWAYLPAAAAIAVYDTVNSHARRCRTPGDPRTADQRRADAFVDLVLGEATEPAAQVKVTVPASTLLGIDRQPGELAGYGPIPAELATEIAADATWRRLLTDPASGVLLDHGRTTYRPPAALADFVRARDKTCRFPGCLRPAEKCQIDHRTEYPDGPTCACNLDSLCTHHHQLKHDNAWLGNRLPNGDYEWLSPAGRYYVRRAEPIAETAEPVAPPIAVHEFADPPPF